MTPRQAPTHATGRLRRYPHLSNAINAGAMAMADFGPCSGCGAPGSGIRLNNRPYCDRCADERLAAVTGWPTLPTPPPAEVIIGPDKKRHFVRYRLLRMPGGVVGLAEELGGSAACRLPPRTAVRSRCRSNAAGRAPPDRSPRGYRPSLSQTGRQVWPDDRRRRGGRASGGERPRG